MKTNIPDMPLFFNQAGHEAAQLLKRLDQYQTFDEIKEFLVDYTQSSFAGDHDIITEGYNSA